MKRDILCENCAKQDRGIDPGKMMTALDAAMMAQEQVVKHAGKMRGLGYCDQCATELWPGDRVECRSIVGMGQHYYEWEDDYIVR